MSVQELADLNTELMIPILVKLIALLVPTKTIRCIAVMLAKKLAQPARAGHIVLIASMTVSCLRTTVGVIARPKMLMAVVRQKFTLTEIMKLVWKHVPTIPTYPWFSVSLAHKSARTAMQQAPTALDALMVFIFRTKSAGVLAHKDSDPIQPYIAIIVEIAVDRDSHLKLTSLLLTVSPISI